MVKNEIPAEMEKKAAKLRFCVECGVVLPAKRWKHCRRCRPESDKQHGTAMPDTGRFCEVCGEELQADEPRFCASCRLPYQEAVRQEFLRTGRLPREAEVEQTNALRTIRARLLRKCRPTGDEIERLAELYDVPYNSYGKMRAYIEEFDRLPPERFLKSRREHPVVEAMRELENR